MSIDSFVGGVLASIIAAAVIGLATFIYRHRTGLHTAAWALTHPRTDVRVSVGVLCRVQIAGKFLLVSQGRRPGQVGPVGGAIHLFENGERELEALGFTAEPKLEAHWASTQAKALRGTCRGWKLLRIRTWIGGRSNGRETFEEAVHREMYEELDIENGRMYNPLQYGSFTFLRHIEEPPHRVEGAGIWQWRSLRVFDFVPRGSDGERFVKAIESLASNPSMGHTLATAEEISRGRRSSGVIGDHSEYMFRNRRRRHETAPPP